MSEQMIYKEETKIRARRPKLYKVIIHNDDYTTMEFVIEILVKIFNKQLNEATRIMLDVHEKGMGAVGLYPYDIAATKIAQVKYMARESGFPLKLSLEEE